MMKFEELGAAKSALVGPYDLARERAWGICLAYKNVDWSAIEQSYCTTLFFDTADATVALYKAAISGFDHGLFIYVASKFQQLAVIGYEDAQLMEQRANLDTVLMGDIAYRMRFTHDLLGQAIDLKAATDAFRTAVSLYRWKY